MIMAQKAEKAAASLTFLAEVSRPAANEVDMLGAGISSAGLEGDVERALQWVTERRRKHFLACANPHSLVLATRDPRFMAALRRADCLTPDGIGITLAARILSLPLRERVVGYDFFSRFSAMAAQQGGIRYFFLGASDAALARIVARMEKEYPSITVCGTYAPPFSQSFSDAENAEMIATINAARPDVLWVGMTAPKQEKWIHAHLDRLDVPFAAAVGAVFDFYAGTRKRAPAVFQQAGLEWLFRFVMEPGRLWRRNLQSSPRFILMVFREKLRRLME